MIANTAHLMPMDSIPLTNMSLKYEMNKLDLYIYFPTPSAFLSTFLSLQSSRCNPTVPGTLLHCFLPECCSLPGESSSSLLESWMLSTRKSIDTQIWYIETHQLEGLTLSSSSSWGCVGHTASTWYFLWVLRSSLYLVESEPFNKNWSQLQTFEWDRDAEWISFHTLSSTGTLQLLPPNLPPEIQISMGTFEMWLVWVSNVVLF